MGTSTCRICRKHMLNVSMRKAPDLHPNSACHGHARLSLQPAMAGTVKVVLMHVLIVGTAVLKLQ